MTTDTTKIPNYVKKMTRLFEAGVIKGGEDYNVVVAHDNWCAIYKGNPCDCDPDILNVETGEILNHRETKR